MTDLTREDRRAYAKAIRRFEHGISGFPISLFRSVTLTTRKGDDNSTERFSKDLKRLIMALRRSGHIVEYCGCYELTPKNRLLHWHGVFRLKGGYFPYNKATLGAMWEKIHGANQVDIKKINREEDLIKYVVKHSVKDYLNQGEIYRRFFVSKKWVREGIKNIERDFREWWRIVSDDRWMTTVAYQLMNMIVERWCKKQETVEIENNLGWFIVNKEGKTSYGIHGERSS